jgi:hypothetical protein
MSIPGGRNDLFHPPREPVERSFRPSGDIADERRFAMRDRWTRALGGVVGVLLLAACAAPADADDTGAPATTTVPELVGHDAVTVDKVAAGAGVVPIVETVADGKHRAGTVIRVDPAAGTAVPVGSTITVAVAGAPGTTADEIVAGDRRTFVGLGVDSDGTLVIALAAGADRAAAERRIRPALAGKSYRVRLCATSWTELSRVIAEVSRRDDMRGSKGYSIAVEPAVCAVQMTGDIPADVAASLRSAYGDKISVTPGPPAVRGSSPVTRR